MITPEPPTLDITEVVETDAVRLVVSGELDMAVVDRLRRRLDGLAESEKVVVLDLSRLTFIDSSGLNLIITAHRDARREGRELRVDPNVGGPVQRVIRMMGLDGLFWDG